MPRDFDASKDVLIKVVKVKNEREGYSFEVRSYDCNEPRVKVTRFYKAQKGSDAGAWKKDDTKYPRLSFRFVRWLMQDGATLDAAGTEWWNQHRKAGSKSGPTGDDEDPF